MIRSIIAMCAGALTLAAFSAPPAFADGDRNHRNSPVITKVTVEHGEPSKSMLIIRGKNLRSSRGREETRIMLGEQGPLEIMNSSDSEITVRCFFNNLFDCEDGDYKLMVAIGKRTRDRNNRGNDDGFRIRRLATYDLTIGAVGPQGEKGDKGDQGDKGDKGDRGDQGVKGDRGDQGVKGDQGDKGDTGNTGPVGPEGPEGLGGGGSAGCPCFDILSVNASGATQCRVTRSFSGIIVDAPDPATTPSEFPVDNNALFFVDLNDESSTCGGANAFDFASDMAPVITQCLVVLDFVLGCPRVPPPGP